ncbi:MAG TPA: anti-sigma factor antagonist [bacterium]|nr:anti-sigma factor antagonist [bacterium]
MLFERKQAGDVVVVRLRQDTLTGHEAPDVKTGLLELLAGEGDKFLVNMKNVQAMDSTGLGALLFGIRQAENQEKDLRFCELSEKSRFLVKIARLDSVIDIYETEAEALADFKDE